MINATHLYDLRSQINRAFIRPEPDSLIDLEKCLGNYDQQWIGEFSSQLIAAIRAQRSSKTPFAAFLQEYSLNSDEGIVLMGIAEALLRIPDIQTRNHFLQEKLIDGNWRSHGLHSDSLLVNLASSALLVGAKIEDRIRHAQQHGQSILDGLLVRLGEPLICSAITQAIQQLAHHFVMAETIDAALTQAACHAEYRYSFDMLGESALTEDDARRYYQAYFQAIETLAQAAQADLYANPGISIKLSALYPRYEALQHRDVIDALSVKLLALAKRARDANITVTVDAEEAERLEMSLDIFTKVAGDPALAGWPGLGLAVQAYQKRAVPLINWLAALAEQQKRLIPIRLVKGAYWDTEIKRAQQNGWDDYPVFIRKAATDVSYLACARLLLANPERFYPQFATHNTHTVAAICWFGQQHPGFEFQRLHGMGEALYEQLLSHYPQTLNCRVYAPVGSYRDLLPYLVRRLLENGANTSFVHQIENPAISVESLIRDPLNELRQNFSQPIARPPDLFGSRRQNAQGLNLNDLELITQLQTDLDVLDERTWQASPLVSGQIGTGHSNPIFSPFDRNLLVGHVVVSQPETIERALQHASRAFADWRLCPVETRAAYCCKAADLLEQHRLELVSLIVREGGRTVVDALAEIREAVDLCRYYAACAVELFGQPQVLPGPTGESNHLLYYGRGVFVCISPWNFPVAIFMGQIVAALVTGNTVIAKPALQTSLTAMLCLRLLHQAGIPENVLHFLPGEGADIGRLLLSDERVAGVAFTGSSATAQTINRQLANRSGAIACLIAETGGQNVMIADSSAHEEQLVADALHSAFNSAGQRCSALRVLFLPEESADKVIVRLIGAMQLLRVGSPAYMATDIGPVIDQRAIAALSAHIEKLQAHAKLLYQLPLEDKLAKGHFFPPTLFEIPALSLLEQEVFGPILHIVRYASGDLANVVDAVNATGYGLTLGVHSRIKATMQYVQEHARVGNIYINRNIIGAVVGVQPFGGMNLSGTGPKAGGPNYLQRFVTEQTVTTNIAAIGGNPWLLNESTKPR
ncbi:bifunctional proline dehydrogenase/L-glutamate gamma-semialdehyde dehydrogenase PutA [Methylomonas montana]|uniref:bifunctional proline dehydrogenase/L-glutamate gamma-semialdehyde dehydrogenase PutA n=1 Tax=Methylomonas montana TaxID=3058963 RepID=UPI00265853B5|nr:bifunctional proline dehydrogenase/L-glutamate gamma-semialdehyde dehydrogenase PutA [Methylomonas montana]WKJ92380.1 bifunctional proline dehydrogenase/L-glutamate gamma-semialdehyde dehydrogenase PutA [Methylomonas montana]